MKAVIQPADKQVEQVLAGLSRAAEEQVGDAHRIFEFRDMIQENPDLAERIFGHILAARKTEQALPETAEVLLDSASAPASEAAADSLIHLVETINPQESGLEPEPPAKDNERAATNMRGFTQCKRNVWLVLKVISNWRENCRAGLFAKFQQDVVAEGKKLGFLKNPVWGIRAALESLASQDLLATSYAWENRQLQIQPTDPVDFQLTKRGMAFWDSKKSTPPKWKEKEKAVAAAAGRPMQQVLAGLAEEADAA